MVLEMENPSRHSNDKVGGSRKGFPAKVFRSISREHEGNLIVFYLFYYYFLIRNNIYSIEKKKYRKQKKKNK